MTPARVLVVDDNAVNARLVRYVLELHAFDVAVAGDAEAALSEIQQRPPQVILMDLALPGQDGLALTRQLKADAVTRDIVVIAVTAFAMSADRERALAAGCDDFIPKPIDTRKLSAIVARHLAREPEAT